MRQLHNHKVQRLCGKYVSIAMHFFTYTIGKPFDDMKIPWYSEELFILQGCHSIFFFKSILNEPSSGIYYQNLYVHTSSDQKIILASIVDFPFTIILIFYISSFMTYRKLLSINLMIFFLSLRKRRKFSKLTINFKCFVIYCQVEHKRSNIPQ